MTIFDALSASLDIAADRGGDPVTSVYARLFAVHPAMEREFWRDTSGSVRGEMLARSFEVILDLAGANGVIGGTWGAQFLATELSNHHAYGIAPAVFGDFLPIIADVIQDACGPEFTGEMAAAWAQTIGIA
ncbi:globin, partial [Sandarakinorhabdus sp.]|uniref:globin n=1 Tax=Sandarakinorhabdus sp. TaxID=1916663 RepID=UPI0033403FF1